MSLNKIFHYTKFKVLVVLGSLILCDCAILQNYKRNGSNLKETYEQKSVPTSNFSNFHCGTGESAKNCSEVEGDPVNLNLTEDGYLISQENQRTLFLSPDQFCILKDGKHAKRCVSHSAPVPWRKCCPVQNLLNPFAFKSCMHSPNPFQKFRPEINGKPDSFFVANTGFNSFSCPKGYHLRKFMRNKCAEKSMTRFQISPNGIISYEVAYGAFLQKSKWKQVSIKSVDYCLDGVITPTSTCNTNENSLQHTKIIRINEAEEDYEWGWDHPEDILLKGCNNSNGTSSKMTSVLYICLKTNPGGDSQENISGKTTFLAVIWLITCPLLLGASLGNLFMIQRNVHGWILTCYLLSMCILNILSVIYILNIGRDQPEPLSNDGEACTLLDFAIKFTYMSTLCWMTSINFGLWKTFSFTLPQPAGLRRFIASALFSLGFPGISIALCYLVAYWGTDPQCKKQHCLLFSHDTVIFYSVPMGLLVVCNFAVFLKTLYTISNLRKDAEEVLKRQAEDHMKSFALFAKLFLLTGSIWPLRLVLFVLQLQGLYLTWYGAIIEMIFSIPELAFPLIIFHHPEFIKWSWQSAPRISRFIFTFDPLFNVPATKCEAQDTRAQNSTLHSRIPIFHGSLQQ